MEGWGELLERDLGIYNQGKIGVEVNLDSGGRRGALPQGGAFQAPQMVCPASLELLPPTRRLRQGQIPGPSEEGTIDHIITDSGEPGLKSEVPLLHFFLHSAIFL